MLGIAQGKLGSDLSRLESASRVTSSQELENSKAYSTITSADLADESARLLRNKILQDTSTALLAQANQQGEIALGLLRF